MIQSRTTSSILGALSLVAACANPESPPDIEDVLGAAIVLEDGRLVIDEDVLVPDREAAYDYYARATAWANARAYLEEQASTGDAVGSQSEALTQATFNDVDSEWAFPTQTNLTYCVRTDGFGDRTEELLAALDSAAESWSRVVNVRFVRVAVGTCNRDNDDVIFNVRRDGSSAFNAAAFFPHEARSDRELLVTDAAFTNTLGGRTLEGILRHELGHVLGFRHEHIWASCTPESPSFTDDDDNEWGATQLTPYDVNSVMHYPSCRPSGTGGYVQTADDYRGAVAVYGLAPALVVTVI